MEIIKEKIMWIEKVADKVLTINTDSDVIVPDTKPDIKKILQVDASAKISGKEIQSDRILINGAVAFNVIYLDDEEGDLHYIKTLVPFTDVLSFKGVTPSMLGDFEADVAGVSYKIINGRKFTVKSTIEIATLIGNSITADYVNDIPAENVQSKKSSMSYLSNAASFSKSFVVNDNILIPQSESSIAEVVKVSPVISEYTVKVISNKVILKGEIKHNCVYTDAADNEIKTVNSVSPFTEILDVDGIKPEDLCNVRLSAVDNTFNCQEDVNSEIRGIETATEILVKLFALREENVNVISDCYATTANLSVKTIDAFLPQKICDINYEETLNSKISLDENAPSLNRIYDIFSKAYIENVIKDENGIVVNGTVDSYILYVTDDKDTPVYCIQNETAFSKSFDCNGSKMPDGVFGLKVLNTSYAFNNVNNIELRVNVKLDGVIWQNTETKIITDISVDSTPLNTELASVTVYFVQENDSLWDIAKKYYTTTDAIKELNEIGDEVQKGMQLLIPKFKKII